MSRPFLSIITINFNNLEGMEATAESVWEQTFTDFEYIIIDGDSSDGSKEFIRDNSERFTYWISEPDSGIYNAMNKGLKQAKGKYHLFLNSGDVLTSEKVLETFINHPEFKGDIIYGDYAFEKGQKQYPDQLYEGYFLKTSLPHQSTIFHHRVFEIMGPYNEDYPMCADRAFYLQCYLSGKFKFQHIPLALSKFDLSGVSNDPEFGKRKKAEDERMLKELYGDSYVHLRKELDEEIKQKAVPKYSPRGIWKRIRKRFRDL